MAAATDTPIEPIDAHLATTLGQAAALAHREHPHPNPRVGCVVVAADGSIVGRGAHVTAGGPHAEVIALQAAGSAAAGATLVVTLEPCTHHGRTPPCVDAIVAAGVRKVVVGALDPDERVDGGGVAALRSQNIELAVVPPPMATEWVDPGYFHHRRTGLPYVTVKVAATIDGQVAAADGTSQWITSEAARADGHGLRSRSDAVLVGAGTAWVDDPRLDVRLEAFQGRQPTPVVVGGTRGLPERAQLLDRDALVYRSADAPPVSDRDRVVAGTSGRVDLAEVFADLGKQSYLDVLVEGGPQLLRSVLEGGHAQRIVWYMAARLAGGTGLAAVSGDFATLADAVDLDITDVVRIGPDVKIVATVVGNV